MANLYVDKKVRIDAPAAKIWDVLTSRMHTDVWSIELSGDGPVIHVESSWQPNTPVEWKDEEGNTLFEGVVTAVAPQKSVRYTFFDTSLERPENSGPEDGVFMELVDHEGGILLHVRQGDFGGWPDGLNRRAVFMEMWDRALSRIKTIAETPDAAS